MWSGTHPDIEKYTPDTQYSTALKLPVTVKLMQFMSDKAEYQHYLVSSVTCN
jgi:hypothetical protein